MDEASVKQIVKSNNDELMSSISELISSQISSLKRSAEEVSPNQILREIKKIKTSNRPSFNKKSNEEQYKSATQILDTLEEANFNLEESNIPGAKGAVQQGIALPKERQKLILLADKSKFGWKTVKEYSQHELAENSDDEKKIYTAEARAAKTLKKSFANRPRPRNYASASQNSYPAMGVPIPTVISRGPGPSQLSRPISTQRASLGTCFACGKPGHWRSSCPFNQQSSVQENK